MLHSFLFYHTVKLAKFAKETFTMLQFFTLLVKKYEEKAICTFKKIISMIAISLECFFTSKIMTIRSKLTNIK